MKALSGFSLAIALSLGPVGFAFPQNPNRVRQLKALQVVKVSAAGHTVDAWLADDEAKNEEGLMFVTDKEIKSSQGMLFLFPVEQVADKYHGFWMHNTLIPLDILYIGKNKKVVSISQGKVKDDTTLLSKATYFYVLELKAGTAKKLGIKPGTVFKLPANLKFNG